MITSELGTMFALAIGITAVVHFLLKLSERVPKNLPAKGWTYTDSAFKAENKWQMRKVDARNVEVSMYDDFRDPICLPWRHARRLFTHPEFKQ